MSLGFQDDGGRGGQADRIHGPSIPPFAPFDGGLWGIRYLRIERVDVAEVDRLEGMYVFMYILTSGDF